MTTRSIVVSLDHYDVFKKINQTAYPELSIYGEIYKIIPSSWISDRTEIAQSPFKTFILPEHKFKNYQLKNIDLESALYNRAKELINRNKKIYLSWSGGIDSTLCLVSLIKAGINSDQLIVCMNNDGIRENPYFYKNYILPTFHLMSIEKFSQILKYDKLDGIFVNGDPADALMGIDFALPIYKKFGYEFLNLCCSRENVVKYFTASNMTEQAANCWFDFFLASRNLSPRPINNIYDFSWWCTFNHRWQTANEKIRTRYENDVEYVRFFNNEEFICWSINQQLPKIEKYSDFKKIFKEIIYKFDKNFQYLENKIKLESVSNNVLTKNFSAVLDDSSRLKFNDFDLLNFYQKNNFFSDWIS